MNRIAPRLAALALASLPLVTLAHTGGDGGSHHGFVDGLSHPFTGLDHLAAMLAVGYWSALTARRIWVAPLAFALCLAVGAGLGLGGIELPAIEPMIAVSLLVLGLLAATRASLPAWAGGALVGAFALFHGLAHGLELAGSGTVAPLLGMLLGTLVLHTVGLLVGRLSRERNPWWPRLTGGAVAAFGAVLLLPMVAG
ncbi:MULTISPECIES: HupE/UreJ family protein [Caldimonas]|uniref:HupE/UreJ family protein n=1 Tax=Caldimonas TaxID=196013 RepID=UPI000781D136|nr:HupE/UreJ family protein [Caldimonas taiwanensis]GIX23140.1 MAG: urease accessory protein [Caldimonas sp.]